MFPLDSQKVQLSAGESTAPKLPGQPILGASRFLPHSASGQGGPRTGENWDTAFPLVAYGAAEIQALDG